MWHSTRPPPKINRPKTMGSPTSVSRVRRRPGRNSKFTWLEICIRPTPPPPHPDPFINHSTSSHGASPLSTNRNAMLREGPDIVTDTRYMWYYRGCTIIPQPRRSFREKKQYRMSQSWDATRSNVFSKFVYTLKPHCARIVTLKVPEIPPCVEFSLLHST